MRQARDYLRIDCNAADRIVAAVGTADEHARESRRIAIDQQYGGHVGAGDGADSWQHRVERLLEFHALEQQPIDLRQPCLRADALLDRAEREIEGLSHGARRIDRALGIHALEPAFLQGTQGPMQAREHGFPAPPEEVTGQPGARSCQQQHR